MEVLYLVLLEIISTAMTFFESCIESQGAVNFIN